MEAVEFYAASESQKVQYFQEKLTKLLGNTKIYERIEQEGPKEKKPVTESPPRQEYKINVRKQMELNKIMGERKAENMRNEILKNCSSSAKNLTIILQNNLGKQESEIAKRYFLFMKTRAEKDK
jgi:hypothetical protein